MPIADTDRDRIVQAIRTYIAKERISREEFAQRAKLGKSTVDKLVVGIFSEKTILQIESLLNVSLVDAATADEKAAEEFGGYSRAATIKHYVGKYVFVRPSFQEDGTIQAFPMEIEWNREARALLVKEIASGKKAPPQFGKVYIPPESMHLFILSNEQGWLKTVILTQIDVYKRMKGIMLTMGHAFGKVYTPVAMPVVMNKCDSVPKDMVGRLDASSGIYAEYNKELQSVEQDRYAKWLRVAQG
jgi:hypothetical protein